MSQARERGNIVRHALSAAEREPLVARLAARLGMIESVVFAYLFGSFAEGRPFADIDVAVFLDFGPGGPSDALDIRLGLTKQIEDATGLPADVIVLNDAPLGLRMAAVGGRLVCSRDEPRRLEFVERTSLQAMDMAFLARESLRGLLAG